MSVLFPSISHITQIESTIDDSKSPLSFPPSPAKEEHFCTAILPGSLVDISEANQEIATDMQTVIQEGKVADGTGDSWCDKYRPCSVADIAGNAKSVQRLRVWLEGWRQRSSNTDDKSQRSSDSG